MSNVSKERIQEVLLYAIKNGDDKAIETFAINLETLSRYKRKARKSFGIDCTESTLLDKIGKQYSRKELEAIAKGGRLVPGMGKVPVVSFEGKRISSGHITDTHFGSLFTDDDYVFAAFEEFKKEKVDFITHSGDVSEGMSNRPGHFYELSHIGFAAQKKHSVDVLGQWSDTPVYMISGNHDQWYLKSNGANIVEDIASELSNYQFIGHDEGDISLKGKITMRLWHGGDGSSYATSYRMQKVVESLSGGEKPNIMLLGHTHKQGDFFIRNVHCVSVGCIQRQTQWMRSKRLEAHPGFYIVDTWVNDGGVSKIRKTWYPFYA